MNPTLWSLFFGEDELPPEAARRILTSTHMRELNAALRGMVDRTTLRETERSLGEALRAALDLDVLHLMLRAWRDHPGPRDPIPSTPHADAAFVLSLGEHEIVSMHEPRIDVLGPSGTLGSLAFRVRLELAVQSATVRMDARGRVLRISIGACRAVGTLALEQDEVARFENADLRFPEDGIEDAAARALLSPVLAADESSRSAPGDGVVSAG